jgi:hypothetical protein
VTVYAARTEDGVVTQVIVGTPEWAVSRLGGTWVASEVKVGVGWTVQDGVIVPPEPEPDDEETP